MNDWDISKKEIEREHLGLFLDAYERATGGTFSEVHDNETPDFMGRDHVDRVVGIEIVQLRFAPDERHIRRIFLTEPHDPDAWWRLIELMHRKRLTLTKGHWAQCQRKILVIVL